MSLLVCWMPKITKQKLELVFGYWRALLMFAQTNFANYTYGINLGTTYTSSLSHCISYLLALKWH